jgi:hypothetical protein
MIIIKVTGGLGNQLFQYAVGRAISDHHKIPLKLDITDCETCSLHNGYRLDQFNTNVAIASKDEIQLLKGSDNLLGKFMRALGFFRSYYKERQRNILDNNIFDKPNLYLNGYWQNEKYFFKIKEELIKELEPMHPLSSKALTYRKNIISVNSVSLHVRRGDFLLHSHINTLDVSFYQNAISYIESKVNSPVFFIFSNDYDWCRENLKFIKNAVFVEDSESDIDDLMLMSYCKHNIIANSSFSWWAAWINTNSDKIVIAPKKWLEVDTPGCKWAADDWVEM